METQPNYVIVGAVVVGLFISAILFIMWISRVDFNDKSKTYLTYFEGSVTGLRVNEQVRYHGLPVGVIKNLEVDKENLDRIKITLTINEPDLIREDSIASIEMRGLTGYSYIQIEGGSKHSPLLKRKPQEAYPVIPSKPSSLETIFTEASKAIKRLSSLSETLDKFFDKDMRQSFHETVAEARSTLQSMRHQFGDIKGEMKKTMKDVRQASIVFGKASTELEKTLSDNREAIDDFTHTSLYDFSKLMLEARQSLKGITRVVNKIEASPLEFLYKDSSQGLKVE
jgi:phospholipid/cholesterol/gamma-HCH transport system substrate-binding protein